MFFFKTKILYENTSMVYHSIDFPMQNVFLQEVPSSAALFEKNTQAVVLRIVPFRGAVVS